MCIIVCKPAGVDVPSAEILATCFVNNPDGAGFMLAAKNSVHGFKGLMCYDEFMAELQAAEKRFGNLKKLPVVMHFRIGTHGSNVAGNTHPFPLKGGYREMRHTRWEADQGFAHNGIILSTSTDPDIKKFNVSDTMVFAKKYVNPIAKHVSIASDLELATMLQNVADSKLCFLDKKGKLVTCGDFVQDGGVYYSNSSYKPREYKFPPLKRSYYDYGWSDYYDNYADYCYLSEADLRAYKNELAEEYGYVELPKGTTIKLIHITKAGTNYTTYKNVEGMFIDDFGSIHRFDPYRYDFICVYLQDEYEDIDVPGSSDAFPTEDDDDDLLNIITLEQEIAKPYASKE